MNTKVILRISERSVCVYLCVYTGVCGPEAASPLSCTGLGAASYLTSSIFGVSVNHMARTGAAVEGCED